MIKYCWVPDAPSVAIPLPATLNLMGFDQSSMDVPFVSALIVVRNECEFIGKCLVALLAQDYPQNGYEILVVDGISDDGTLAVVQSYIRPSPTIRILSNSKRTLAAGWNLGIAHARGEYIVRLDAHAIPSPDYLRRCVDMLESRPNAACVGGRIEARGQPPIGDLIAEVLGSPFGVGNSRFRVSKTARYVDTLAYGMYRRQAIVDVGWFREDFERNQDLELHCRLRRSGGKFYLDPSIRTLYYCRGTVDQFLRQAWQNGWWNVRTLLVSVGAVSLRHLVPMVFVLCLITSTIGACFWSPSLVLLLAVLGLYVALAFLAALFDGRGIRGVLFKPLLFFALHVSYGTGSLVAVLSQLFTRARNLPKRLS